MAQRIMAMDHACSTGCSAGPRRAPSRAPRPLGRPRSGRAPQPARCPARLSSSPGELHRLVGKLPETALEVAHSEQLHAEGHRGVWLARRRAGLGRLDRPPLGRLHVTLNEAPGRLGYQPSPAEAGLGHRRQPRRALLPARTRSASGPRPPCQWKTPGSRDVGQPWVVQALGEVEQLVDQQLALLERVRRRDRPAGIERAYGPARPRRRLPGLSRSPLRPAAGSARAPRRSEARWPAAQEPARGVDRRPGGLARRPPAPAPARCPPRRYGC